MATDATKTHAEDDHVGHDHDVHEDGHDHSPSHGHGHRHGHHHHHGSSALGNIGLAFWLNFVFSIVELIGGIGVGSVAIMAGAIHDFGDSISLGIAWMLERSANRKSDHRFNFGYKRLSLLSAFLSGIVITCSSAFIIREALSRLHEAPAPYGPGMIGLAGLGLAVNGFAAWRLGHGRTHNERVLTWHLIGDFASWAVVFIGGVVIHFSAWAALDPWLAIAVSVFVLFNVLSGLKDTLYLFLQGRPKNFAADDFIREALAVPGVDHIDHLAVWSLDGETNILSARLHLHNLRDPEEIEKVKVGVRVAAEKQNARATLETCLAENAKHGEET